MEMTTVPSSKPDIVIKMSDEEARELHGMLWEAKSYASDCGESTATHMSYIDMLSDILNLS